MPRIKKTLKWVQATPENIKPGLRCRLNPGFTDSPYFGEGFSSVYEDIGVVVDGEMIDAGSYEHRGFRVDYSRMSGWLALPEEMEVELYAPH